LECGYMAVNGVLTAICKWMLVFSIEVFASF